MNIEIDPEVAEAAQRYNVPVEKIAPRHVTAGLPSLAAMNRAAKAIGFKNWFPPDPWQRCDCTVRGVDSRGGRCLVCHRSTEATLRRERYHSDPGYRAQQLATMISRYHSDPEWRERKNAADKTYNRERYRSDPEYRARRLAAHTARAAAKRAARDPHFLATNRANQRRRRERKRNSVPKWLRRPTPEQKTFAIAERARQEQLKADDVYLQNAWSDVDLHADHVAALAGERSRERVLSGLGLAHNIHVRPAEENLWKLADLDRAEQLDSLITSPFEASCADVVRVFSGEAPASPRPDIAPALVRFHARMHAALYADDDEDEDRI